MIRFSLEVGSDVIEVLDVEVVKTNLGATGLIGASPYFLFFRGWVTRRLIGWSLPRFFWRSNPSAARCAPASVPRLQAQAQRRAHEHSNLKGSSLCHTLSIVSNMPEHPSSNLLVLQQLEAHPKVSSHSAAVR